MMLRIHRVWAIALAAALAALATTPAQAQTNPQAPGAPPKRVYTRVPQFRLPFNLEESDRARIRDVHLYVKSGDDPWARKESAAPTSTHFSFRAPRDGEYWFTIVIVDNSGNAIPGDVTRQPPGLVVVVD